MDFDSKFESDSQSRTLSPVRATLALGGDAEVPRDISLLSFLDFVFRYKL